MKSWASRLFGLSALVALGCGPPPGGTGGGGRGGAAGRGGTGGGAGGGGAAGSAGAGAGGSAAGGSGGSIGGSGGSVGAGGGAGGATAGAGGAAGGNGGAGGATSGASGAAGGNAGASGTGGGGGGAGAGGSGASGSGGSISGSGGMGGGAGGATAAAGGAAGGNGGASGTAGGGGGAAGAGGAAAPKRIYALHSTGSPDATLEVVDATSWTLIRTVPLPSGAGYGSDIEADPVLERVYVPRSSGVSVVDALTGAELQLIASQPAISVEYLALSPDRSTLFGANSSGGVLKIDTVTGAVIGSPAASNTLAFGIALAPDQSTLVLPWFSPTIGSANYLRFLNPVDLGVVANTAVPSADLTYEVVSPTFTDDGRVLLLDTINLKIYPFEVSGHVALPVIAPLLNYNHPGGCLYRCMAYDPASKLAYARGKNGDIISVDLTMNRAFDGPPAADGTAPQHLEASPGGPVFYSASQGATKPHLLKSAPSGALVYTFGDTKPVVAFRFTRLP